MYSESPKNDEYYSQVRHDVIDVICRRPNRVLELGCGAGATSAAIKELFECEAWGIEINEAAAETARKKLDRVITANIDNQTPELPRDYFDLVICADVLEHLVAPDNALGNLREFMAPDSQIIASIPNISYLPALMKIVRDRFEYEPDGVLDNTHLRFFTPHTMRKLFTDAGFEVITLINLRAKGPKAGILNALTLGLMKRFLSPQYIIKAKK
jgi:2-polyprenyl-3-methyl-5-hydroxy-6-metoxy-1,4-benzoquinol methylase